MYNKIASLQSMVKKCQDFELGNFATHFGDTFLVNYACTFETYYVLLEYIV